MRKKTTNGDIHKTRRTIGRTVGFLFLGLYLLIALLNTTIVQSYLGAFAGKYFTQQWGGKVRIGALHASPFSHLILDKIELISPTNDTIYYGDRITCRFKRFPLSGNHLKLDRVMVRNGRYHFESIKYPNGKYGTNLDFIINYFAQGATPTPPSDSHFIVEVGEVRLRNVDYIQDLPETPGMPTYPNGVSIPHMRFYGTTGHIRRVRVDNDSITCRIVSFSTTEASGQHIVDLSADVEVSPHVIRATNLDLQTDDSRIFADAELTYHGWEEMADYCNTVRHDLRLKEGTEVNLSDAAYWAPTLWGIDAKVTAQGHAYGTIADLHANNMAVTFGESSYALVNGTVKGLPDIRQTTFDVLVNRLHTNYEDLAAVKHPEPIKMIMPELIRQMAVINIDAQFTGGARDCQAFVNLNSMIGDLEAQASIRYDSLVRDYVYLGHADSRTLGLRSILPNEWVSRTGLHLTFQGTSLDPKKMDASLEGRLYDTHFRGNSIKRTTISADIAHQLASADIVIEDTLIGLDIQASANLADLSATADLYLDDVHLTKLKLIESDSNVLLSTHLKANVTGMNLDDLSGSVTMRDTRLALGSRNINMDHLNMTVVNQQGQKDFVLNSDWATVRLNGYFQYQDLPLVVRDFSDRYLPVYYNPFKNANEADLTPLYKDNFDFDIVWNDANNSFQNVLPGITIAAGTSCHGSYNYGEVLKAVFRSDQIAYNNIQIDDIGFHSNTVGENYQMNISAGSLTVSDMTLTNNVNIRTILSPTISALAIQWHDNANPLSSQGDLEFFLNSSPTDNKLMITKPTFYAGGEPWTLVCQDGVKMNKERLQVDNLRVYGLGQSIAVNVMMQGEETDYVRATFNNFVLDRLDSIFIPSHLVELDGRLSGDFNLRGLNDKPYFDADLTVDDCVVNGQEAGQVDINAQYAANEKKILLDLQAEHFRDGANHYPIDVHGSVSLATPDPALDFDLGIENVALQTIRPFVKNFSSNIDGNLDGDLMVKGTISHPIVDGILTINDGLLGLTPTGVTYYFNNEFDIVNDSLLLKDFYIHDKLGNTLTANGTIALSEGKFVLDLGVSTPRLLVLDKEADGLNSFYGRLLASANGHIEGPIDDISITATASTIDGSELYVPIDNSLQVSENNQFITFISNDHAERTTPTTASTPSNANFNLLLNLTVTPGMSLYLPMDFDQLGVNVNAVGQGAIQVSIHNNNPPNILGDYEFTSGNFKLSLMQLVSRNFRIEEGSTINFPGNINDARFNLNAVYGLRTNLASLMNNSVTTITNDSYVQVQDVIMVSGTLQEPTIKFDIRLPNAEQSVSDQVFSYIDKNNELEMLNQSMSLLLLGSFSSVGTSNDGDQGGFNSIGMITNTASSIITSMIKFVDVDIKYQAATTNQQGQIDVGISKRWNNLYIESTFGYSNNEVELEQNSTLVGDVEIGYKFNPYFDFYGFHRTNTSYYTRTELPYKQGLGVKLSKDFDSFYDLFPWLRKRKKTIPIK